MLSAFIPLVVGLAAACVVPRARALGGALAIALISMFSVAGIMVQTTARLRRLNWRGIARALGPATVPRAILGAGADSALPLKIYLPRVNWVQQPARTVQVQEVDLVGATRWLPLVQDRALDAVRPLGHDSIEGVAIVRLALRHPVSLSVDDLRNLAPRWLRRPSAGAELVFFQQAASKQPTAKP